ncbi:hypothetical protein XENOCAPTIV_001869 [Xenoophorus captivus]|uniref:Uncharacterized protein n=1 Tax=Xenoophorus captivus TaxID=1517983 RepID=A0ABV0QFX4_9TELE
MRDIPSASLLILPFIVLPYSGDNIYENVINQQLLTTLVGSLCPGRYFTFSWLVLIISVSLRPFTISSKTHIFTVLSNLGF